MDFRTIRYEKLGAVLRITANRPEVLNAQSRVMILELDEAFRAASEDDAIRVIIVAGAGAHFSAGHDLGSPDELEDQKAHPVGPGLPENLKRLSELYLETCLRWREVPKPTIAQVQGYCIMGGLMLASCCDLIIAADDAFFADPVVKMGIPGVEYFAHPWVMGPRYAKEFLFLGERVHADRALALGMVNRVVPRADLESSTMDIAGRIAQMPRLGLALTKKAVNQAEDLMGLRAGMDSVFGLHHVAHAHNAEVGKDALAGQDARSMRDGSR
jgi:enoyl-CoA hydratase